MENDKISPVVYDTFMSGRPILSSTRETNLDCWVSFLALMFDFNFQYSYDYIASHNYLVRLIDKIDYKNLDSREKMQKIKEFAQKYLSERVTK